MPRFLAKEFPTTETRRHGEELKGGLSGEPGAGSAPDRRSEARRRALLPDILTARNTRRHMTIPPNSAWKTRLVAGSFPDRTFDIEFWQEQGDEAIFSAAWELVELAEEISHGRKPTLQRTATTLKRMSG